MVGFVADNDSQLGRVLAMGVRVITDFNSMTKALPMRADRILVALSEKRGRLPVKQLVELGFPDAPHPIVWLTVLGLVAMLLAAVALRIIEVRIDGVGVARRVYAAAGAVGMGVHAGTCAHLQHALLFIQDPDASQRCV